MKKTRIYVDTSVIGGCCDTEFRQWSMALLYDFKVGIYSMVLSDLIDAEIQDAPDEVKYIYEEFDDAAQDVYHFDLESISLADAYMARGILTEKYVSDARHIAIATVAGVDVLVSWNFKHIVHFEKIQKFNAVNIEMGYKPISIHSPREVARYDD